MKRTRLRFSSASRWLSFVALSVVIIGAKPQDGRLRHVVIPFDPGVAEVSASALERFATEIGDAGRLANVLQGALLFDLLGTVGVHYTGSKGGDRPNPVDLDPARPFRNPGETLRARSGNDEDLAVLYASTLLSTGLRAALIVSSGPLLVAVDTGLEAQAHRELFADDDYLVKDGSIWLPVDPTQLGDSFVEAWTAASRLPKRLLIEARAQGARRHTNGANGHDSLAIDPGRLADRFVADRRILSLRLGRVRGKRQPGSLRSTVFLRLSALESDLGRYARASAYLDSAAATGADRLTVLFQRASLLDRQGLYRDMARVGGELMSLDPKNPRGYLVAAYAATQLGEVERAKFLYRKARELSPSPGNNR